MGKKEYIRKEAGKGNGRTTGKEKSEKMNYGMDN